MKIDIKRRIIFTLLTMGFLTTEIISIEQAAEKVPVRVFYESLCPGCLSFMISSLRKTITRKNWEEILDIELIPYGNSQIEVVDGKQTMKCQHGEEECKGNKYHMCILELNHILSKSDQLTIISCSSIRIMAGLFMRDAILGDFTWEAAVEKCSNEVAEISKTEVNFWKHIKGCFDSDNIEMIRKYEKKTKEQEMYWAPYIMAFGTYSRRYEDEIKDNMYAFACKYFSGKLPAECRDVSLKLPTRLYKHYSDKDIHGEARKILFGDKKNEKHCENGRCKRDLPKGYKMAKKIEGTKRIRPSKLKNLVDEKELE